MPGKTTEVKKVKAYPIRAQIKSDALQMQGSILRLADVGFLAELSSNLVATGDKFEFSFELPVTHKIISGQGVIVKVYNQFSGSNGSLITAEIHFRTLSAQDRTEIIRFIRATESGGSNNRSEAS